MRKSIKILAMGTILVFGITSCEKEPFKGLLKNVKHNKKETKSTKDSTHNDFAFRMTVVYLPAQCESEPTDVIGLEMEGKYYSVIEDKSGKFISQKVGEIISVNFSEEMPVFIGQGCDQPKADFGITLNEIY